MLAPVWAIWLSIGTVDLSVGLPPEPFPAA